MLAFIGGVLLVAVIWYVAAKAIGPKTGVAAAVVTTVALLLLNNHNHRDR